MVLGSEDDFVKQVKKGDRVILWVRAQYPVSLASQTRRRLTCRVGVILSGMLVPLIGVLR